MEIGVSLKYDELDQFPRVFEAAGFLPAHVQIRGLPARLSGLAAPLKAQIDRLRGLDPAIAVSLHAYKFNLCERVEEVLGVWLALARETLAVAAGAGASFVNFHAGFAMGGSRIRHSACRDALVPVFRSLAESAASAGIGMHVENLYPRPLRSEYCMLGDRASDFDRFFTEIDSPRFKLCYDYGHGNIDEYGIEILRRHAGRLGSVHAHDNDQQSDLHLPVLSKRGTIDWTGEFGFLERTGFAGPFIVESSLEDQIESLRNMKKAGMMR